MFQKIIALSVRNPLIIGLFMIAWIAAGVWSIRQVPIDAVPDITNNQVQVVTISPSLSAEEVEQFITYPLEIATTNIPGVQEVRSVSKYGLSVLTVVFDEGVPVLDARQYVSEQISIAEGEIPEGFGTPELMPITTGLGEIYQYTLEVEPAYRDRFDVLELRTIQDWIVKRQLSGIEGIIEVSSFGGKLKQYQVNLIPDRMRALNISLEDISQALRENNENTGGSYIESGPNAFYLRAEGVVKDLNDLRQIPVGVRNSVPILLEHVATMEIGYAPRFGAMTKNGLGEAVGGITLMLKDANSSTTIGRVQERIERIQSSLPQGVSIKPYLDRSDLVGRTTRTVMKNLIEGGLIVILVLVIMLGNLRAGIVVASVIPLAMLFALTLMNIFGVSANLMSLGAIDFGIVIDGAVIIAEHTLAALTAGYAGHQLTREKLGSLVEQSTSEIYRSAAFGVLIILVVFLPIISLQGVEGKMFRPMAQVVSFAILGALILSVTYVPTALSLGLSTAVKRETGFSHRLIEGLKSFYAPSLQWAMKRPRWILGIAAVMLFGSIALFGRLGSEFIPTLEEGDLAMQMQLPSGSSLEQSIETSTRAEGILIKNFPEVEQIVSKIGTAEVPTDPMSIEQADIMIILKPKSEWVSANSREELIEKMKSVLAGLPGASFEFTQPIQLRFNELISGAKSDIAVKIFGPDNAVLAEKAKQAAEFMSSVNGASDIKVEQTDGLSQIHIDYRRDQMARYGVSVQQLNDIIRTAYAGQKVGVIFETERKFDLVIRLPEAERHDVRLDQLYVRTVSGNLIPVSEVAELSYQLGPAQVSREDSKRRIVVGANVRGRDIESVVLDMQEALKELDLPAGYFIDYGGDFEQLQRARKRLMIAVPVALFMILVLLYLAFGSTRYAIIIFSAVPLSAIGGILALYLRDMPFSISAGIGFIALFGVAVLNGIVLIAHFNQLKKDPTISMKEVVIRGGIDRMRPVLMTASVAALGFLPMALSTGAGAEVQKPLATVVIGGLVSATLLTLVVLPIIYYLAHNRSRIKARSSAATAMVVLMCLVAHRPARAQESLTLDSAISYAMKNDLYLKEADATLEQVRNERGAVWNMSPMQVNYQFGQIDGPDQDYNFSVSQNLGSPLEILYKAKWQAARTESAESRHMETKAFVTLEIEHLYEQWRYRYALYELHQDQRQLWAETLEWAKKQRDEGAMSEADYLLFRAKWIDARKVEQKAEQDFLVASNELQLRTGVSEPPSIPHHEVWSPIVGNVVDTTGSPLVMEPYRLDMESARARLNMEKSTYFPQVNVGYFNQQLGGIPGFQGWSVGLQVPIWYLPQQSQLRNARVEETISEARYNYALRQWKLNRDRLVREIEFWSSLCIVDGPQLLAEAEKLELIAEALKAEGAVDPYRFQQSLSAAQDLKVQYLESIYEYNKRIYSLEYLTR